MKKEDCGIILAGMASAWRVIHFHWHPLILATLILGVFFTISGWRKTSLPDVHEQVFKLFERLNVRPVGWLVVLGEFFGGLGLLSGVLSTWAAIGLIPIMLGAYCLDTIPEIVQKHPQGISAWCSKSICNPEFLLLVLLITLATNGAA